jgi:hypothetical protein
MNTAMARRLASGDRVIWTRNEDCRPSGFGTITRITAHQVEVVWEGKTARRYRRAQLHYLRHVNPRCKPHDRLESADVAAVCAARPEAQQDRDIR